MCNHSRAACTSPKPTGRDVCLLPTPSCSPSHRICPTCQRERPQTRRDRLGLPVSEQPAASAPRLLRSFIEPWLSRSLLAARRLLQRRPLLRLLHMSHPRRDPSMEAIWDQDRPRTTVTEKPRIRASSRLLAIPILCVCESRKASAGPSGCIVDWGTADRMVQATYSSLRMRFPSSPPATVPTTRCPPERGTKPRLKTSLLTTGLQGPLHRSAPG